MKNVLLFDTAIATSNVGDEIILASVKKGLDPILSKSAVYRLGTHVENFSPLQMLISHDKVKFFSEKMDYKFICGTNLLVPNLRRIFPQFMLNPFNKSLYKDAILVGVGKHSNYKKLRRLAKYLYLKTLSKKYYHSVRDEATKQIVEEMGFKAINTGCPTLWEFTKEKCASIPQGKAENVIFSVSGYLPQQNPVADLKMIKTLKKNYSSLYAWIQTYKDEDYLKSLIDIEKEGISCIYSLDAFAQMLDTAKYDYVGTRLHGGIFALQHNCRSIIISIDHRAEGFHESNNIPILRRQDIDNLDALINSNIITDIRIDTTAINQFLSQF